MRRLAIVPALLVTLPVFAQPPRLDSAHTRLLLGQVADGRLYVDEAQVASAAAQIKQQLYYIVGHLNGYNGGADMSRAVITLRGFRPTGRGETEVIYGASFTVAWPANVNTPASLSTVLPRRADDVGRKAFFDEHGRACQSGEEPASAGTFFYYYRPQRQSCGLLEGEYGASGLAAHVELSPSPAQTTGKFPEYHKIWEDDELTMTFVFGTYEDTAGAQDVGIANYNKSYKALRKMLGKPAQMNVNLSATANPGLRYPDIEMTYRLANGKRLNLALLLVRTNQIAQPSAKFLERYNARTEVSDFVAYNGHSGLGANIRALAKIGKFVAGRYQIFLINGCDTFTYNDDALAKAHGAVNPADAPTRHLDVITNAMPSQFQAFAQNATAITRALLEAKATYRQILANLAVYQRAIVDGEEDNKYPDPF